MEISTNLKDITQKTDHCSEQRGGVAKTMLNMILKYIYSGNVFGNPHAIWPVIRRQSQHSKGTGSHTGLVILGSHYWGSLDPVGCNTRYTTAYASEITSIWLWKYLTELFLERKEYKPYVTCSINNTINVVLRLIKNCTDLNYIVQSK